MACNSSLWHYSGSVETIKVSDYKHTELAVVAGNGNHSLNLHQKPVPDTENQPFWQLSVAATYQSGFDVENAPNRQPQRIHIVKMAVLNTSIFVRSPRLLAQHRTTYVFAAQVSWPLSFLLRVFDHAVPLAFIRAVA